MTIEWNKIATNAISALVVTVFLGAATIVWKGATSVDTKVQNTRDDMTHLIDALSDELGSQKAQLTSLSNQLVVIIANQPKPTDIFYQPTGGLLGSPPTTTTRTPTSLEKTDNVQQSMQRKAFSKDIMNQLKR